MKQVILNDGLGVESTAILLHVIRSAATRADLGIADDFSNLTIVTAMTGDEWPDTKRLNEEHMLPLLAKKGIRYVQLARTKPGSKKRFAILSDSTSPRTLFIEGDYKLSDEMRDGGTLAIMSGTRKCSIHAKGDVIDPWIEEEFGSEPFTQIIGFNAEETKRVTKEEGITSKPKHRFFGQRTGRYPLVEWSWGRLKCEQFVEDQVGEPWKKSACFFCPFAKDHLMPRFHQFPFLATQAIVMEYRALALNPRTKMFNTKTVRSMIETADLGDAIENADKEISKMEHAVVRVRRVFRSVSLADRKVEKVARGSREAMEELLAKHGRVERDENGIARVAIRVLDKTTFPALEEMLVVAPADFMDKEGRGFAKTWDKATGGAKECATEAIGYGYFETPKPMEMTS